MNQKNHIKSNEKFLLSNKIKLLIYFTMLLNPQINFNIDCYTNSPCGFELSIVMVQKINGDNFE